MGIIMTPYDTPKRSISLQTRKGNNVDNCQSGFLTLLEKSEFADLERKYPDKKKRTEPNAVYNCHGLVFGARRTAIDDGNEIMRKIIPDDEYHEIALQDVLAGDIALYFGDDGDIEHSAIVVSEPDSCVKIPMVVSKWGKYSEVIHLATYCEYSKNIKYYRVTK